MNWMNSRKDPWTRFAGITLAIMVLFSMSLYDVPAPTDALAPAAIPTRLYPTPVLVSPADGTTIIGEKSTNFSWQWSGTLQKGQWFDLRICRFGGACSVSIRRRCNCLLDTPPDGFDDYWWQVAVVRIDESGNISTLCESPKWPFVWYEPDAVVNTEALNLRSGPGVVYDIPGLLKRGDLLKVTGRNPAGNWLKVICPGGQEGWVAAWLLEINLPLAEVTPAPVPPTPTPMHTPAPIATPVPTLLPPPIPLEPENGAAFLGEPATLKWQWDYRSRAPNEVFSVRVRREGETRLCHHDKADKPEYKASLSYCTAGTHYWSVALVRDLRPWLSEEDINRWQDLSTPSAERWFYYVPGEEPWTWPTPDDGEPKPKEPPKEPP